MQEWKTLSRTTILRHSKFLEVENHAVELPDGRVIPDWPWVKSPDYVNVIVKEGDAFLFFRQTKYAVRGTSLAPVGGYLDPGEDPMTAAVRELREEIGYAATEWHSLGSYAADGNRGGGIANLYFARDAKYSSTPVVDDLEEQEIVRLTPEETRAALDAGEFKVLAWATATALALLLDKRE